MKDKIIEGLFKDDPNALYKVYRQLLYGKYRFLVNMRPIDSLIVRGAILVNEEGKTQSIVIDGPTDYYYNHIVTSWSSPYAYFSVDQLNTDEVMLKFNEIDKDHQVTKNHEWKMNDINDIHNAVREVTSSCNHIVLNEYRHIWTLIHEVR